MKNSSLVALSIACASVVAMGCHGQSGDVPVAGNEPDPPFSTLGGGPTIPNGASPACLSNSRVRQAITALGNDRVTAGGVAMDGTYLLPSMPDVPSECRHILKDLMECALRDDQSVMDQENGAVYTGQVGLAEEWGSRALFDRERRWVSACMIQRLNYFGISVPILLEGDTAPIAVDPVLRQSYPFAESTAWGDIFKGSAGDFAWICTEEDVWSICPKDLGEPWVDTRVCDGVQDCGIAFAGRCSDACTLTAGGYWDCSAQFGFVETVRVRMETNTHPPVLGMCQ
jgi:hypothetical protein